MTQQEQNTGIQSILRIINQYGMEGLGYAVSILINEAMKVERSYALKAQPWERSESRTGYANGFKDKRLSTRLGTLNLKVPQVRGEVNFYPSALEKGLRSERALTVSLAEMYVQGVSTRKVTTILEVSSTQVSNAAKQLDKELEKWRVRPIGRVPFLQIDARYEKVRQDGVVRSCAVLIVTGVMDDGKRSVLGVSVSLSETEVHWRQFLLSLKSRGNVWFGDDNQ